MASYLRQMSIFISKHIFRRLKYETPFFLKHNIFFFLLFLSVCSTFLLYAVNEQAETKESFSFCLIADPHASESAGHLRPGYYQYGNGVDKFLACIKEIRKLPDEEKPDFIMILGDVHLWALGEYLDEVKIPIHVISGNAETRKRKKEMRAFFPDDFKTDDKESDYYAFVHQGVRFICLCNARGSEHIGMFCSEDITPRGQIEWLEKQLEKKEPHKIIFAHIPPEPNGEDKNMYMCRNDSRYFNKLIEQTQPTATFFGHLHKATNKYNIGESLLCTLRSCTWNLDRSPIGFMMVEMSPKGISTREIITGYCQKPPPKIPPNLK
ncbi:MAG: metallophosphoesterase [Anaerohalosphaeraceae bacterium]|nr:metallophosphoesterase [Anaerohalosphaeraceae bacterium]